VTNPLHGVWNARRRVTLATSRRAMAVSDACANVDKRVFADVFLQLRDVKFYGYLPVQYLGFLLLAWFSGSVDAWPLSFVGIISKLCVGLAITSPLCVMAVRFQPLASNSASRLSVTVSWMLSVLCMVADCVTRTSYLRVSRNDSLLRHDALGYVVGTMVGLMTVSAVFFRFLSPKCTMKEEPAKEVAPSRERVRGWTVQDSEVRSLTSAVAYAKTLRLMRPTAAVHSRRASRVSQISRVRKRASTGPVASSTDNPTFQMGLGLPGSVGLPAVAQSAKITSQGGSNLQRAVEKSINVLSSRRALPVSVALLLGNRRKRTEIAPVLAKTSSPPSSPRTVHSPVFACRRELGQLADDNTLQSLQVALGHAQALPKLPVFESQVRRGSKQTRALVTTESDVFGMGAPVGSLARHASSRPMLQSTSLSVGKDLPTRVDTRLLGKQSSRSIMGNPLLQFASSYHREDSVSLTDLEYAVEFATALREHYGTTSFRLSRSRPAPLGKSDRELGKEPMEVFGIGPPHPTRIDDQGVCPIPVSAQPVLATVSPREAMTLWSILKKLRKRR
jgi:hypothetical protein